MEMECEEREMDLVRKGRTVCLEPKSSWMW